MDSYNLEHNKEDALRQITQIKNHLVDKQAFYPYNYNAMYVWSVIAFILTFVMVPMYEIGIAMGTAVMFVLIAIGFVTEGIMTKKINKNYDIEDCTLRQQFIIKSFFMVALFLVLISAILALYQLYVPLYLSWLFLISLVYWAVGFVLNIRRFTQMAMFNIFASLLLLGIAILNNTLLGVDFIYFTVVQIFMVIGLTILPAHNAWLQKRDGR